MTLNGNDWYGSGSSSPSGSDPHGLTTNPSLTSPGSGGTCYSSGTAGGPQPCPSAYKLQGGSPMIGAGQNLNSTYGINPGTRDYFRNSIPNGLGSGFNVGADGGNP
jgi:hypothetical protein